MFSGDSVDSIFFGYIIIMQQQPYFKKRIAYSISIAFLIALSYHLIPSIQMCCISVMIHICYYPKLIFRMKAEIEYIVFLFLK